MHDYIICSYSVDLKNKTIEICAEYEEDMKRFFAQGVLTHSFETILEYNIILDIQEIALKSFIEQNKFVLEKKKQECWPINYETLDELKEFLYKNQYKYITIETSYGLQGWILAKEFRID